MVQGDSATEPERHRELLVAVAEQAVLPRAGLEHGLTPWAWAVGPFNESCTGLAQVVGQL